MLQVVAAAVVLAKAADDPEALIKDIQRVTGEKLAAFKARCFRLSHPPTILETTRKPCGLH